MAVSIPVRSGLSDPDQDLLQQAKQAPEGDLRAFEQLLARYQKKVVANCRYITRDPNCAEDLAQEVLVKVFFALNRFEGRSSFASWVQRIKVNHCLTYLRKQGERVFIGIDEGNVESFGELQVAATAEQQADAISERQLIGSVLDAMNDTLRVPLILCDMDGLSYEEVAQTLGINLSAAKMRIKRGREEFRHRYQKLETAGVR